MMNKYIIVWDIGYGETAEIIEEENQAKADMVAYEAWREEAESNADYHAIEYTDELADNYGLNDD